uniref:ATP-grasp domain-containing protein n=1 Tax=Heterorhabditis bacteriophora TaxID=37862 RepID=A0A1I7WH79_HETBA
MDFQIWEALSQDIHNSISQMQAYTIIVILWKYRLNLSKLRKPNNVRVFVVGPPRMLCDETNCYIYNIYIYICIIEGYYPEQLDQILNVRDAIHNPRKNGLATLRQCSLSGTPQPEQWMDAIRSQIGGFPAVVRPLKNHCTHTVGIVRDENEFKSWLRRNSSVHQCEEYIVQQYIDDGHEFAALCTAKSGLIVCFCFYNFFIVKATFPRSYAGVIFIKGFYKDHNDIFFLGFSLEPESETFRTLLGLSKTSPWETIAIESYYEIPDFQNGQSTTSSGYNCVINFPTAEGVLLHQTSIPKRWKL